MKIGFLSHNNLGLYRFRSPIMAELVRRGCEVYAICPKGEYDEEIKRLGVKVVNYNIVGRSVNPLNEIKAILNIRKALKDLDLDVLHTFTVKPNLYGTLIGKIIGIKKIFNLIEGLGSIYAEESLKYRFIRVLVETLYRQIFRLSNGCIFVNESDPEYYRRKNIIDKEKIYIIKSVGIDAFSYDIASTCKKSMEKVRQKLNLGDKKIVLMVARGIWQKGIREYFECAQEIKSERDDVEFLLAGGTDDEDAGCASAEFLKSGKVKWLGEVSDIQTYIGISDICVLPSFYKEGLSRFLLEASSMSKPIITTDIVGCNDVVSHGENGFLVKPKDVRELVLYTEKLLDDDTLRQKMGENSRNKVLENFEQRLVVEKYVEFYTKYDCLKGCKDGRN